VIEHLTSKSQCHQKRKGKKNWNLFFIVLEARKSTHGFGQLNSLVKVLFLVCHHLLVVSSHGEWGLSGKVRKEFSLSLLIMTLILPDGPIFITLSQIWSPPKGLPSKHHPISSGALVCEWGWGTSQFIAVILRRYILSKKTTSEILDI
jgi:hypothetical protein